MAYSIREMDWDTEYFGIPCARVHVIDTFDSNTMMRFIDDIKPYGFVTIDDYAFPPNSERICELPVCHLVDVPVELRMNADKTPYYPECEDMKTEYVQGIEELAEKAFLHGRFYMDSHISAAKADGLYRSWVMNVMVKGSSHIISEKSGKGFLVYSYDIKSGRADIDLLAVSSICQREGVGKRLLSTLCREMKRMKISSIYTATQAHNIPAMNFYLRNGFVMARIGMTYHLWNKR